jgi:hypothetical protein
VRPGIGSHGLLFRDIAESSRDAAFQGAQGGLEVIAHFGFDDRRIGARRRFGYEVLDDLWGWRVHGLSAPGEEQDRDERRDNVHAD